MFALADLLAYDSILIQCHDNPDADAISSAFAVHTYLAQQGKPSKIVYAGLSRISKSNIKFMVEWLEIPIEFTRDPEPPDLLVCVDCQYGEGNVTKMDARSVAVIDHHLQVIRDGAFDHVFIQPNFGSCATVVWDMLRRTGFDFSKNRNIATALYYGLLTDTNHFAEITHPADRDMRDELPAYCDMGMVRRLRNCNLTMDELEIAGVALLRNVNDGHKRYALFKAEMCDPNILGFISDIGLQVDTVDVCVVYSQMESGARLSIRSCAREVMASELAAYLTRGVGSGGGHRDKAGGHIQKREIDELGVTIDEYIKGKIIEYFDSYDIIIASGHSVDVTAMKKYRKKLIPQGFVVSAEVFSPDTPLMIRTLEGDVSVQASPGVYLMVGIHGEVYPIKTEKFHAYYKPCDQPVHMDDDIYAPTVKNERTGEVKTLTSLMRPCVSSGEFPIYAGVLTRNTKVFTDMNPDSYRYGKPGDYLAVKCDDLHDVYVVQGDRFTQTYTECP